jgi:predicted SPOUT superfamily RNA methylase MTH1
MLFNAIKFIFHTVPSLSGEEKVYSGSVDTKLCVAIPASLVTDTPHLREKTAKLGTIARACAIFGTHEIILYPDGAQQERGEDMQLCEQILGFIETPQYLRKRLFGLSPSLKYAGILPPLQIPPHDVPRSIRDCKEGDVREGVVVARHGGSLDVDVGLERTLECSAALQVGTRITVQLTNLERNLVGEIIDPTKISIYWGYRVKQSKFKLAALLEKERFDLRIGTSRYGANVLDIWPKISSSMKNVGSILVAFGSPRLGLTEILSQEGKSPEGVFSFLINTVPAQNVATVRTEEAVLISLGLLNCMRLG